MASETVNVLLTANSSNLVSGMNAATQSVDEFSEATQVSETSVSSLIGTLKGLALTAGFGAILKESISSAMDAVESESLFDTSLGAYADSARKWSDELGSSLGLDSVALRKNVGTLYEMTKNMGVTKDSALDMSEGLTKLAEDMASFYNLSSDEAFNKIKSGLTGEAEPLKSLGILVDENTVKQYAYKTGIAETGAELTQTQKVMARYQAIMAQTSTAQGDLARTMDSPANKLRAIQNDLNTTMREFGTAIMPTVSSLLSVAKSGIETIAPYVKTLGENINNIGQAIANASPSVKTMLLLMLSAAVAIPAVTAAQKLYNAANGAWGAILNTLIPKEITRASVLKATFGWLIVIAGVMAALASIGARRKEIESGTYQAEADGAEEAADSVDELADSYDGLGDDADSAKKSLADIDTLNIAKKTAGTGGIDFAAVTSGAESATDEMDKLNSAISDTTEAMDGLNGFSLGGLSSTLSQTFSDISTGFGTVLDAFNFDSDTQLTSLRTLNSMVEDLFGEDWTDFWQGVGSTIYKAFGQSGNEIARQEALGNIQGWLTSITDITDSWLGGFGKVWNDFWQGVGNELYKISHPESNHTDGGHGGGAGRTRRTNGGGAGGRSRNESGGYGGGGGGRSRYEDYNYTDYSTTAEAALSGAAATDSMRSYRQLENSTQDQNISINATIELDGDKVGEYSETYRQRNLSRGNGY